MTTAPSTADWNALQGSIAGDVVLPDSADYDRLRTPAMARFWGIRPAAVVRCRMPADVAETLAFAHRARVHVAARSGGHCFAGRSSTAGIVIDVAPMRTVAVADGVATVGAGARLADLYDALEQRGLTIPAGCGPTVGIAGLTLGGGFGILGRRHGLTCDRLLAAQVVLADGRVVDCDEHHEADLFWALRGAGGGQFGVVTSLVFDPLPAPAATTFHLVWPQVDAEALIGAWQGWAPDAPDELAASLQLTAAGEPDAAPVINVFGAMLGGESDTVELLGQLAARVGTDPATAAYSHLPYRAAKRALVGLGGDEQETSDRPRPQFGKSEFFRRPLPADAIATLVRKHATGRGPGVARELNFTPWGGAYNRVATDATPFAHRGERFLVEHVLIADPQEPAAGREWLRDSWATVHPWAAGRVYPNFPDPELANSAQAYHGENYERLRRVKRAYDPHNMFRFEQSVA
jgi:FAD/FMN-containing dehydrogenase